MIESLIVPKNRLLCINESLNCQEAIQLLESNGLRCAPVLDATNTIFRGNIYRYHIYQHKFRYPQADLSKIPVTHFLKNTTKVVRTSDSILRLLFVINDLPHIAVLSDQNTFVGIIEHTEMMTFLAEAWLSNNAKYVLEVTAKGQVGELTKLIRLINRYTHIISSLTFENTKYGSESKFLFVLPGGFDIVEFNDLQRLLNRKQYKTKHYKMK